MKTTRRYLLTFITISLIVLLAGLWAFHYCYQAATQTLLDSKMESGSRESREIGHMLENQLKSGIPPAKVIENLQQSILNTDAQSEFICMYDTAGIELCHPNPALIGQKIAIGNSRFQDGASHLNAASPAEFTDILHTGKANTGIRSFPEEKRRSSEIVSVYPVIGSDWMVASHANIDVLQQQLDSLYHQFMIGILVMIILIAGICSGLIRLIYHKYEHQMEEEILRLNDQVNTLNVLNRQLELSQQKTASPAPKPDANPGPNAGPVARRRLITYQANEMTSIEVNDIAFIFLSEETTTAQTFLNKQYTLNISLDELIRQLDNELFYRANRQYIVNVNAIKTIQLYGRNQLQLITQPASPDEIIVSKNKVAEFKKWLDR